MQMTVFLSNGVVLFLGSLEPTNFYPSQFPLMFDISYFFEGVVPQDDESLNGSLPVFACNHGCLAMLMDVRKEELAGTRLSPVFPTSSNMDQSPYQIQCLYLYSEWNVCPVNVPPSNDSTTPGSFSSNPTTSIFNLHLPLPAQHQTIGCQCPLFAFNYMCSLSIIQPFKVL
ncbi:hypothetical protein C8J55DRAFT_495424 [Lentinula edodes]|uniref:Uncharacterized protein n=1 Tax=Lentinula lateritia TaxID=40482 RepID=A0A9W9E0Y5_9AGAR|nr:hypothetical protein C8J55DRAFT_495424 [Lentinula edodes]